MGFSRQGYWSGVPLPSLANYCKRELFPSHQSCKYGLNDDLKTPLGISLVVQRLRLLATNARGLALIPGQGTNISHAMQRSQKIFFLIFLKCFLSLQLMDSWIMRTMWHLTWSSALVWNLIEREPEYDDLDLTFLTNYSWKDEEFPAWLELASINVTHHHIPATLMRTNLAPVVFSPTLSSEALERSTPNEAHLSKWEEVIYPTSRKASFPTKKLFSKLPKHCGIIMGTPTLNRLESGEEQLSVGSRIICQFTAIISLLGECPWKPQSILPDYYSTSKLQHSRTQWDN